MKIEIIRYTYAVVISTIILYIPFTMLEYIIDEKEISKYKLLYISISLFSIKLLIYFILGGV